MDFLTLIEWSHQMKKMLLLVVLVAQITFAEQIPTSVVHRVINVTDLPKELQHAVPGSYKNINLNKLVLHSVKSSELGDPNDYIRTSNPLDFALLDPGYVVTRVNQPISMYVLTRDGQMDIDQDGYFNIFGLRVQSSISNQAPSSDTHSFPDRTEYDMQLPWPIFPPMATNSIKVDGNLSSIPSLDKSLLLTIFDSLGNMHFMVMNFTALSASSYEVNIKNLNDDVHLSSGVLSFDTKGQFLTETGLDHVTINEVDGADPIQFSVDFRKITHYPALYNNVGVASNGFNAGELDSINILNDGTLVANYSNDISIMFGSIRVTKYRSDLLTPYIPLYPEKFWLDKINSQAMPDEYYNVRFFPQHLEKSALSEEELSHR